MTLGKHAAWYSLNWHDLPLPPFAAMNGYRYRTSFSTRVFPFLVSWLFLSSVRNNYDKWTSRQRPTSEMCLEGGDQKLFNVFETHSQTRKRSCGKFLSQFYNVTLRKLFPSNNKWKFPFFSFSSILFPQEQLSFPVCAPRKYFFGFKYCLCNNASPFVFFWEREEGGMEYHRL